MGSTFYFIQESPYVLFKLKHLKQLVQVLLFIAKENWEEIELIEDKLYQTLQIETLGVKNFKEIKTLKIVSIKDDKKKNSLKQYWKGIKKLIHHKELLLQLSGAAILAGNIYLGYGLSILIP